MRSSFALSSGFVVVFMILAAAPTVGGEPLAKHPDHWVAAMYFHRTHRCPTCRKIGGYIQESIETGFPKQMKSGRIGFFLVDFQDPKNAKQTSGYKVASPTLVMADVHSGRVTRWKAMPKVWSLVGDKEAFFKYVRDGVKALLAEDAQ